LGPDLLDAVPQVRVQEFLSSQSSKGSD
jgi:hypothetical protein